LQFVEQSGRAGKLSRKLLGDCSTSRTAHTTGWCTSARSRPRTRFGMQALW
jgi:hypothetical protein